MLLALMRLRLNRWDDAHKWATLIRGHLGQNAGAAAGPRRMADPITINPITDEPVLHAQGVTGPALFRVRRRPEADRAARTDGATACRRGCAPSRPPAVGR